LYACFVDLFSHPWETGSVSLYSTLSMLPLTQPQAVPFFPFKRSLLGLSVMCWAFPHLGPPPYKHPPSLFTFFYSLPISWAFFPSSELLFDVECPYLTSNLLAPFFNHPVTEPYFFFFDSSHTSALSGSLALFYISPWESPPRPVSLAGRLNLCQSFAPDTFQSCLP